MATLALGAVGSSLGASFLPAIGGISGAALGQAAGAIAGQYIDQSLFASSGQPRVIEGPRLSELDVTTSSEGRPIVRSYGRNRVSGEMIWATKFEEEIITNTQSSGGSSGGKGGGGSASSGVTTTEYRYYANFAVALSEGELTRLGQVWANGNELNLADYTYRFYKGSEIQDPDSLIEAREGIGNAPAYRGLSYIVFERMPLRSFGNRIPQLSFEIFRRLDDFEADINAIGLIPSSGEYVYENDQLTKDLGLGFSEPENIHTHQGLSDWDVSLNQLEDEIPNVQNVSLFVSWFGTDLRAGQCQLQPGVDNREKVIIGRNWSVSNQSRSNAYLVSLDQGRAAYGGTPSDETVVSAIQDLKARGFKVTFNPFILMDVPAGNSLPDPYNTGSFQAVYPWRGRITVDPAPGQTGSPDKTSAATSQLQNFIGSAARTDFTVAGNTVTYSGPAEWSYRRMVLHYAHLCASAGGVDSFVLGSEMRGVTTVRNETNAFPMVDALVALAADVKTILGSGCKLTYGADWSEYFGHQPSDGTGDVYFHLDPLWSSANIDAVGIDCYWPLSDWRSGQLHLDAQNYASPYELDYLQGNIAGGEGYEWYYASDEDRQDQIRTPISDGQGKPWVFRYKDIQSWWANSHYDRPGGVEAASPTTWVPQSKPIWLMEIGCPAVHLGSNQPNLFVDPKSSESQLPYFSNGTRDDYIQRRYISALMNYFTPGGEGFSSTNNPLSTVYSGRMVDPERIYVYTWDARPYPAFPANLDIWGDGENWLRGHWLNGRVGSVSLAALVSKIMIEYGFDEFAPPPLNGIVEGYLIDRIMSARDALQPLELAFFFDSFESEAKLKFKHRGSGGSVISLSPDQLVEQSPDEGLYQLTRGQETELPRSAKISFIDGDQAYQPRALEGQQTIGQTKRVATAQLPMVLKPDQVQSLANKLVQESWAAREEGAFSLPLSLLKLEPTDIVDLALDDQSKTLRITEINDQQNRAIQAQSIDPLLYEDLVVTDGLPSHQVPEIYGPSKADFFDFPLLNGNETDHAGYVGAFQDPWPGQVAFYRSAEDGDYRLNQIVNAPVKMGVLLNDLASGPCGRWDYANKLQVQLDIGELNSASSVAVLGGKNIAAVRHDHGGWEMIQFQTATLIGAKQYELSGLLRAQGGTEDALQTIASSGSDFVLIDEALVPVNMGVNDIGLSYYWRYGPAPYGLGHPAFQTNQFAFGARGLRPFSPVHLSGGNQNGDFHIHWIRRSRVGGDNWELEEVPIGETLEHYEIDILDNGSVMRTISTQSPEGVYSAGDQLSDWGAVQSSYHIKVYQISEIYGRGGSGEAVLLNQ